MAKTYNGPFSDVTTGSVYTAAAHNDVLENLNNYRVPPMCRVKQTSGQVVYDASSAVIAFNAEDFDTDAMHDNATNNSRVTIKTAGVYLIIASAAYTAGISDDASMSIFKNGAGGIGGYTSWGPANTGAGMTTSILIELAVNDYIQLLLYQNNSANTARTTDTTQTYLMALWQGQVS